jgi:hypothetical protein
VGRGISISALSINSAARVGSELVSAPATAARHSVDFSRHPFSTVEEACLGERFHERRKHEPGQIRVSGGSGHLFRRIRFTRGYQNLDEIR